MKHVFIGRISQKQRAIKAREKVSMVQMMKESNGMCWLCGARRAVEPNHTKDRKHFVPSCRACHSPGGVHQYLEEET